jgi:hypothetical protein
MHHSAIVLAILALLGLGASQSLSSQPSSLPTVQPEQAKERMIKDFDFPTNVLDLGPSLGVVAAHNLIGKLCAQTPENTIVKGALNLTSLEFMAWAEYRLGYGQNGIFKNFFAVPPMATFAGRCNYIPIKTWVENGPPHVGKSIFNYGKQNIKVDIPGEAFLPGLVVSSNMASWSELLQNTAEMSRIFKNLKGPPEYGTSVWDWVGLDRMEDTIRQFSVKEKIIGPCWEAWVVATTVERVVLAVPVYVLQHYNWIEADGEGHSVRTWQNLPGAYEVFSDPSFIKGRGLALQTPDRGSYVQAFVKGRPLPPDKCE